MGLNKACKHFTKDAIKGLKKFNLAETKTILRKIEQLDIPFPENLDIKKLRAIDGYRLRIGNKRVIFEIEKNEIIIRNIDFRGNIY